MLPWNRTQCMKARQDLPRRYEESAAYKAAIFREDPYERMLVSHYTLITVTLGLGPIPLQDYFKVCFCIQSNQNQTRLGI
jgi:hypothetical protein